MDKKVNNTIEMERATVFVDLKNIPDKMAINLERLVKEVYSRKCGRFGYPWKSLNKKSIIIPEFFDVMHSCLSPTEEFILVKLYGLEEPFECHTTEEISMYLNISLQTLGTKISDAIKIIRSEQRRFDISIKKHHKKWLVDYYRKSEKDEICVFNFSTKTYNALNRNGVKTIEDLLKLDPIKALRIRNMGLNGLEEISVVKTRIRNYIEKEKDEVSFEGEFSDFEKELDSKTYRYLRENGIETVQDFLNLTVEDVLRIEELRTEFRLSDIVALRKKLNKPM